MKTIEDILKDFFPAVYFMGDERTKEKQNEYIKRLYKAIYLTRQHYLDLLPEEEKIPKCVGRLSVIEQARIMGRNQAIQEMRERINEKTS